MTAGDVFQCVLSQRFDCKPGVDAFEIYRSLRIVNPSPYMYFLRFDLPPALSSRSGAEGSASVFAVEDRSHIHASDAMKGLYDMGDAPSCSTCGAIMVRNGSCYRCMECGSTSGCS